MLDHERLDVYQASVRLLALAVQIVDVLPRGHATLADQLRRAAVSIPLNIAEGSGKRSEADRRRFRQMARGSAYACAALLDVLHASRAVGPEEHAQAKELVERIVAMLTRLC
jgi:four helix bundle protein